MEAESLEVVDRLKRQVASMGRSSRSPPPPPPPPPPPASSIDKQEAVVEKEEEEEVVESIPLSPFSSPPPGKGKSIGGEISSFASMETRGGEKEEEEGRVRGLFRKLNPFRRRGEGGGGEVVYKMRGQEEEAEEV